MDINFEQLKSETLKVTSEQILSVSTMRREIKNFDREYMKLLSINEDYKQYIQVLEKALELASENSSDCFYEEKEYCNGNCIECYMKKAKEELGVND